MIRKIGISDSTVRFVSEFMVRDIRVYHFTLARISGLVGWQPQPPEFFWEVIMCPYFWSVKQKGLQDDDTWVCAVVVDFKKSIVSFPAFQGGNFYLRLANIQNKVFKRRIYS